MKKRLIIALVFVLVLLIIVGLVVAWFQVNFLEFKKNVIGKSSVEIEALYGTFDNRYVSPDEDGNYKNTVCSYFVVEERVGFLGTTPPYMVSISFDSNGIAYEIFFQQGGLGG